MPDDVMDEPPNEQTDNWTQRKERLKQIPTQMVTGSNWGTTATTSKD